MFVIYIWWLDLDIRVPGSRARARTKGPSGGNHPGFHILSGSLSSPISLCFCVSGCPAMGYLWLRNAFLGNVCITRKRVPDKRTRSPTNVLLPRVIARHLLLSRDVTLSLSVCFLSQSKNARFPALLLLSPFNDDENAYSRFYKKLRKRYLRKDARRDAREYDESSNVVSRIIARDDN